MVKNSIFERTEKKYVISVKQKEQLLSKIMDKIYPDEYGATTIQSIYWDTDNFRLIRASMSKPVYKEKLRIRAYGQVKPNDSVFVELKKKYAGITYKRREKIKAYNANRFYFNGQKNIKNQILREIKWTIDYYKLSPKMLVCYDREAYYSKESKEVRITFDENPRYRTKDLYLSKPCVGESILPKGMVIMEIKTLNSMPMWISSCLTKMRIFPTSFSKYAAAYMQELEKNDSKKEVALSA